VGFTLSYIIKLFITVFISLILTPFVKIFAVKIGAVDQPNKRRINTKAMPSAGGLAIYISFFISTLFMIRPTLNPEYTGYIVPILIASGIIVITGLIDDVKEIKPWQKSVGILLASLVIFFFTKSHFDTLSIPGILPMIKFDTWLSLPLTLLWIFALTNAVNLIDGLDGLASGVSIIALTTIGIIGYFFLNVENVFIPITIFALVAAILGFFPYNYHPATIYLGDTGALLLGFLISVLSLQGLKNATFVAVLTPMFILGVPITDTVFAIIRRKLNNQPMTSPDKMHLHHRLLSLGFSHRAAVLTIYGLATVFSFIALLLNYAGHLGTILLIIASLLGIELFIELVGVLGENRQPLLNTLKFVGNRGYRLQVLEKFNNRKHKE
jgi:UDP-GlcNAc:undecaprenyl-phosphate GlcNAc-1-phosphate transferase